MRTFIITIILALVILFVFVDNFIKVAEKEIWLYKAQKAPHKYGRCIDCGIVKPHKIMDTNTRIYDKCGGYD